MSFQKESGEGSMRGMSGSPALLASLRKLLSAQNLSAYIVPSCDAHNSEYIAERDKRRQFLSGFSGSAGTAIVTPKFALLWTDGRYHLQAESELDLDNWTVMKEGLSGTPTREVWLSDNLESGSVVGVDPYLVPMSEWNRLHGKLVEKSIELKPININLIDKIWGGDQPGYPENPVMPLDIKFSGESWESKVSKCRQRMEEKKVDCLVLSALDEVAWLLNLRGSDIDFNPVFFSYAAVTHDKVHLFISESQVNSQITHHLKANDDIKNIVDIQGYCEIGRFLEEYAKDESKRIWFSKSVSYGIASTVSPKQRHLELTPVALMKALKNPTEVKGFIRCHLRDAAALCAYFAWLEKNIDSGNIDEMSGAQELERQRSVMDNYVGLSFETISASGPNGAVIHYRPTPETNRKITRDELYLVDSGAQYKDGTTDVTRTLHFGNPTEHEKECFTRVLKGQIRMARMVFPTKLVGNCLDSFARSALWEIGLDYSHGTGHGVGAFLNVHEGPMGISWRTYPDDPGLQENMILSNEPGYYEDGNFGIRLENLVRIVKANTRFNFKDRGFLTFENLTLVPIQRKMIDPNLLSADEIAYINDYHEHCRDMVGPLLRDKGLKDGLDWLMKETEPFG